MREKVRHVSCKCEKEALYFHDFCIRMAALYLSMMTLVKYQERNELHLDKAVI